MHLFVLFLCVCFLCQLFVYLFLYLFVYLLFSLCGHLLIQMYSFYNLRRNNGLLSVSGITHVNKCEFPSRANQDWPAITVH